MNEFTDLKEILDHIDIESLTYFNINDNCSILQGKISISEKYTNL